MAAGAGGGRKGRFGSVLRHVTVLPRIHRSCLCLLSCCAAPHQRRPPASRAQPPQPAPARPAPARTCRDVAHPDGLHARAAAVDEGHEGRALGQRGVHVEQPVLGARHGRGLEDGCQRAQLRPHHVVARGLGAQAPRRRVRLRAQRAANWGGGGSGGRQAAADRQRQKPWGCRGFPAAAPLPAAGVRLPAPTPPPGAAAPAPGPGRSRTSGGSRAPPCRSP